MTDQGMMLTARSRARASRARTHWHGCLYALTAVGSLYASCHLYLGKVTAPYQLVMLLAAVLCYSVLGRFDLEADWRWNLSGGTARSAVTSWCAIVTALLLLGFAAGALDRFSRAVMISWAAAYPLLMLTLHHLLRRRALHRPAVAKRRAVVVLGDQPAAQLLQALHASPLFHLAGVFSQQQGPEPLPWLGPVSQLGAYLERQPTDAVFLMLPLPAHADLAEWLELLRQQAAALYLVPSGGVDGGLAGSLEIIEGFPVLRLADASQLPLSAVPSLPRPIAGLR